VVGVEESTTNRKIQFFAPTLKGGIDFFNNDKRKEVPFRGFRGRRKYKRAEKSNSLPQP